MTTYSRQNAMDRGAWWATVPGAAKRWSPETQHNSKELDPMSAAAKNSHGATGKKKKNPHHSEDRSPACCNEDLERPKQ